MLHILNGDVLEKVEYEETSTDTDLTKCLSHEAAKCACLCDEFKCKSPATVKLKYYLENFIMYNTT